MIITSMTLCCNSSIIRLQDFTTEVIVVGEENRPYSFITFFVRVCPSELHSSLDSQSLVTSCNAGCGCAEAGINPVCGADDTVYFSPCHAGCTSKTREGVRPFEH